MPEKLHGKTGTYLIEMDVRPELLEDTTSTAGTQCSPHKARHSSIRDSIQKFGTYTGPYLQSADGIC